jgi:hypothetical protein
VKDYPLKPPVLLFPGFMSSRLVAWRQKICNGINIDVCAAELTAGRLHLKHVATLEAKAACLYGLGTRLP